MSSSVGIQALTEKKVILAFRLQSVLVILAILAVSAGGVFLTTLAFQIAALYLASNALLTFVPARYYQTRTLIGAVVIVDVLFVSMCIYFSGNIAGDFYLLYFLAIFMAALSRDLRTTVVAAVVISVVYVWVTGSTLGISGILTSAFLLRIPLFFVTAFFAGFLANQARQRETQHQEDKRTAAQLEEQLEHEMRREEAIINRYHSLSRQHQELISNINSGVLLVGKNGIIATFNAEAERLTGLKTQDVLGHQIAGFQELGPINAGLGDILRSSPPHACVESECAIRQKNGQTVTVGVSISPMFGEGGVIAGAIIAIRDLTELDGLRERIHQSERLACLGGTSLCMARMMRGQLKSIEGLARMQRERTDISDSMHQSAEAILSEVDNIDKTVLDTIQFIRRGTSPFETLELSELIKSCVSGLRRDMERNSISITLDLDSYLPCVMGSTQQLRQVIIQVLMNAMEAVENNNGIRISTRAKDGYVLCDIEDRGPGVPEKMRDRLFEPLSTSKNDGTGIGLFISQRIISEHGGSIELLESSENGSLFQIRLPALSAEHAATKPAIAGKQVRDKAAA